VQLLRLCGEGHQEDTLDCLCAGGFIAYDPQIPKELLDNGGPQTHKMDINNTIGHFNLVNYQLKQVCS
jgi:hypothetical protein